MKNMPTFVITTKRANNTNGIRIEPGMQVKVVTNSFSNPVSTNGGQLVIDAFMRIRSQGGHDGLRQAPNNT